MKREAGKLAGKLARKRRREMEREREREERPRGQIQPLTATQRRRGGPHVEATACRNNP